MRIHLDLFADVVVVAQHLFEQHHPLLQVKENMVLHPGRHEVLEAAVSLVVVVLGQGHVEVIKLLKIVSYLKNFT